MLVTSNGSFSDSKKPPGHQYESSKYLHTKMLNARLMVSPEMPSKSTGFRPHRSDNTPNGMAVKSPGMASNVADQPRNKAK